MPRAALFSVCVALASACASDREPAVFRPECAPNQFRACELDGCLGAQQCVEPGAWSRCFCTVLDASYPPPSDGGDAQEFGTDADADSPEADGGSEDADASDASESEGGGDAPAGD
jgi:hypothetical protein